MITRIQKWGNSLGLRIPRTLARQARVSQGSEVDVAVHRGRMVVRPLRSLRYTLKSLLAGVTRANLHAAVESGGARGREIF